MISLFTKPKHSQAARSRITGAFPTCLASDVQAVLSVIPVAKHEPTQSDIGALRVEGEDLHIPSRIYFPEPDQNSFSDLSKLQQTILACLYTRHHDGIVREKWLLRIVESEELWIVPFVLQLAGEYIIEIIEFLSENVELLKRENYASFIKANPVFTSVTSQRILSYWSCYFRGISPRFVDYCGYKLAKEVGLWNERIGRSLMKSTKA